MQAIFDIFSDQCLLDFFPIEFNLQLTDMTSWHPPWKTHFFSSRIGFLKLSLVKNLTSTLPQGQGGDSFCPSTEMSGFLHIFLLGPSCKSTSCKSHSERLEWNQVAIFGVISMGDESQKQNPLMILGFLWIGCFVWGKKSQLTGTERAF